MYGLVNRAVEDLITQEYGEETWERIKDRAGCDEEFFMAHEGYDDAITYDLVGAICEELNAPADAVLELFGRYWITDVAAKHYAHMIAAGGRDLRAFLLYLPDLHDRVAMMFPKLAPPIFVTRETDRGIECEYYSDRPGLSAFVRGLMLGLAEHFDEQIQVEHLESKGEERDHDVFGIHWLQ